MEQASMQNEASGSSRQEKSRAISLRIRMKSEALRSPRMEGMSRLFGAFDLLEHAALHYMLHARRIMNGLPLYAWKNDFSKPVVLTIKICRIPEE